MHDIPTAGLGYYGVPVIKSEIGNHVRGTIKKVDFELYNRGTCSKMFNLDVQKTQFCGTRQDQTNFSEVRD